MPRTRDPLLWGLFSSGGMAAALFLPALFVGLALAGPLGWFGPQDHGDWMAVVGHPLARLLLFLVVVPSFFHAAHRLRYTLYDGLQLYHLDALITALTYGVATILSVASAVILITVG